MGIIDNCMRSEVHYAVFGEFWARYGRQAGLKVQQAHIFGPRNFPHYEFRFATTEDQPRQMERLCRSLSKSLPREAGRCPSLKGALAVGLVHIRAMRDAY